MVKRAISAAAGARVAPLKGPPSGWRAGFAGISINYRLSHEALFPVAVHDGKAAIRWVRAHAAPYGIDPERIEPMKKSNAWQDEALNAAYGQ